MKTFSSDYLFPAPVEQMIQWITTESYLHEKYTDMQAQNLRVEVIEDSEERFSSRVSRDVLIREKVPSFAKKLVKEVMTVTQEITWSKQGEVKTGEFSGRIPGMNGSVSAEMRIEPVGADQCKMVMDGKIEVSIPLIGGKLESLMADTAAEKFEADLSATHRYVMRQLA